MLDIAYVIIVLGAMLFASKLVEELVRRAGFPSFLGSIAVGIIFGPAVLGLLNESHFNFIRILMILGINFLLFLAGAGELSNLSLRSFSWNEIMVALLILFGSVMVVSLFAASLGLAIPEAIALGFLMGIISVGPLTKGLMETGLLSSEKGLEMLKIAIVTEVAGIIFFNIAIAEEVSPMSVLFVIIVLIAVLAAGKYLIIPTLKFIEKRFFSEEAVFATILSSILILGYLAELFGIAAAVVSLVYGVYLSGYMRERPEIAERFRAITFGFLEPLFFAGLGLYIRWVDFRILRLSAIVLVLIALPKLLLLIPRLRFKLSLAMLSKGGVDAALLLVLHEMSQKVTSNLYASFLIAMILSTILASFAFLGHRPIRAKRSITLEMAIEDVMEEPIFVYESEDLGKVAEVIERLGAVVVVNEENRPIGFIDSGDLVYLDPKFFHMLSARDVLREPVVSIRKDAKFTELAERIFEEHPPVVAVIDEEERLVGVIYPKNLLKQILTRRIK